MNEIITQHLFNFWEHIGKQAKFLYNHKDYKYTASKEESWPRKVFNINFLTLDYKELYDKMKNRGLPNSLAIAENNEKKKLLLDNHFRNTSEVKTMSLASTDIPKLTNDFSTITQVTTVDEASVFTNVASQSFGYTISVSTIIPLLNDLKIRLYIGKYNNEFVSCGMIYLDDDGNSGIHMIGTLANYRGYGLGKTMTEKLLLETKVNKSNNVFLVASKAGENIYLKMGFITHGKLLSFAT
ncbi:MAG: hypothetical protein BM557_07325 [Flavobacterium sp. MedPE-SWcel]|uniref:GNAT family N-acetyltransferase n=1 Tax=uncultured Flavobacterium sp. TaxID=165435 RepID=UPI00092377BA|nr:GNAT family N-acetyltransferase [uncultured Flavobacterium sp.]OIQ18022.1 MAG: hypothetical protein BM557_07325 [Flavobacterium sp. MedPE-SWcel]